MLRRNHTRDAGRPLWVKFPSVVAWQTSPGSGTLGAIEMAPPQLVNGPWIARSANAQAYLVGELSLYDGSTELADWSDSTYPAGTLSLAPSAITVGGNGGGTCGSTSGGVNFGSTETMGGDVVFLSEFRRDTTRRADERGILLAEPT